VTLDLFNPHESRGMIWMNSAYEKQPAFFRAMSPELFFEAEAAEVNLFTEGTGENGLLDGELDKILAAQDLRA
jgi:hypothetical protein